MTTKIRILPEVLCNQISAGEVVERPASVIKELLENSLDAGADEIRVEIEKGGKRLIRVSDNGCGMSQDDAFLALERHATSKINTSEDLFALHSFGFRGEALPSIAAVSRLTLQTREEEQAEGWSIYVEGGTVRRAEAAGLSRGTCIEVRDLFFNTPARRKFLRRDDTETSHIADVVSKLALAHPGVHMRLQNQGRTILEAYRHDTLEARIAAVLGRSLLKELQTISHEGGDGLTLHGFIGSPDCTRSTTGHMYSYVNGRYIRDRVIQHAILDGYRNLLLKGRYPVVVLFLEIDPALVDVNVHPTKHEVRFRDQGLVHDFVSQAVRSNLRPAEWLQVDRTAAEEPGPIASALPVADKTTLPPVPGAPELPLEVQHRERVQESLETYAGRSFQAASSPVYHASSSPGQVSPSETSNPSEPGGFFGSLQILGQYHNSYIICQDGNDLVLIDQHAAHERIGFEKLKKQWRSGAVERQQLLFPTVFEVDFREKDSLQQHLPDLLKFGFEVEPFGGNSFALQGIPALLKDVDSVELLRDVAAELGQHSASHLIEDAVDRLLILMACHGMVRANQSLMRPEMLALLRELDQVDFKTHCPHGRPVMKRLVLTEIEKMFKRT